MITTKQAIKKLENNYSHGIDLVYTDYRDYFEDAKQLNNVLQKNDDALDWNCIADSQYETIDYLIKETFTTDELESMDDEIKRACCDWFLDHDTSDPLHDSLKNTPSQFFFYDLGIEIEPSEYHSFMCDGFTSEQEQTKECNKIFEALKLKKTATNKKVIRELYANANYGGSLVVLFVAKPTDAHDISEGHNAITFVDPYICIMDRVNGSGYDIKIDGIFTLPFKRGRLNLDAGVSGYSYSGDVCGLCKDGYDTEWKISKMRQKKVAAEKTSIEKYNEKVAEWDKIKKETGKCSFDDPRFKSHDTLYVNEIPCGNKCKVCGRFFID